MESWLAMKSALTLLLFCQLTNIVVALRRNRICLISLKAIAYNRQQKGSSFETAQSITQANTRQRQKESLMPGKIKNRMRFFSGKESVKLKEQTTTLCRTLRQTIQ
jgi:hypothetical protein